jgi:hypothetical protein
MRCTFASRVSVATCDSTLTAPNVPLAASLRAAARRIQPPMKGKRL